MLWVAVDAMGGDFAPRLVVDGALAAARHFDLGVALVGRRDAIDAELQRHGDVDAARLRIVDAPDVVAMDESPSAALRRVISISGSRWSAGATRSTPNCCSMSAQASRAGRSICCSSR